MHLQSAAAEVPAKFPSDWKSPKPDFWGSESSRDLAGKRPSALWLEVQVKCNKCVLVIVINEVGMISPLYYHTDILSHEIKSPANWNTFQLALKSYQFLVTCDVVENDKRLCHSYKNICANRDRQLPFCISFYLLCILCSPFAVLIRFVPLRYNTRSSIKRRSYQSNLMIPLAQVKFLRKASAALNQCKENGKDRALSQYKDRLIYVWWFPC